MTARLFNVIHLVGSVKLLGLRIISMIRNNRFNHTFKYLKECFRLTVLAQDCQPSKSEYQNGIRVKVDKYGFPTIIPLELRRLAISDVMVARLVLTLLQVFRVFPTAPKVSLETIVSGHTGLLKVFPDALVKDALNSLKFQASFGTFKGFISVKAGPNFRVATLSSFIDAFAFLSDTRVFTAWIRLALLTRSYGYQAWLLLLIALGSPYLVIRFLYGFSLPVLGKLSVVYDQAGKARVVAITNWWIQIALKPLHHSIFRWLGSLTTDGTFDQDACLNRQINRVEPGTIFYSIDLTAATDRIPVEFLCQILTLSGLRGDLWKTLLDLKWSYKGTFYRYAVGQAMGAYSSWAMLATFNHLLVRMAAITVGVKDFDNYCVLGDDIVIANSQVAEKYQEYLALLGIGVSLSKCITSSRLCEFGKRLKGPSINLTPLGAGLILQQLRSRAAIVPVLAEMVRLELISNPFIDPILHLLRGWKISNHLALKAILRFGSDFSFSQETGGISPEFLFYGTQNLDLLRYAHYNGLLTVLVRRSREVVKRCLEEREYFVANCHKIIPYLSKHPALRVVECLLFIISPGFVLYYQDFLLKESESIENLSFLQKGRSGSWSDIEFLYKQHVIPPLSVKDNMSVCRDNLKMIREIDGEIQSTISDSFFIDHMEGDFY